VLPTLVAGVLIASIPGYIMYLLLGPKSEYIFSPEYQDVIAQTRHLKSRTSLGAWGCVVIVVVIPTVAAIASALARLWH